MAKPQIPCNVCGAGWLYRRSKYRMSGIVVFIGYVLLIPSLIGVAVSVFLLFAAGSGTTATLASVKQEVTTQLQQAQIAPGIVEKVVGIGHLSPSELSTLTDEQKQVVQTAQAHLVGGTAGAGLGGAVVGGTSVCMGVSCVVGGLLGWLLVMKKKVLQCNSCGAVVAAS